MELFEAMQVWRLPELLSELIDLLWIIDKWIKEKELRDEILGELVAFGIFFELKTGYDLRDINEYWQVIPIYR